MRIKIGPHRIKVRLKPDPEMDGNWGRFYEGSLEIWINKSQATSSAREATLHEVLHACFNVTGLDKALDSGDLEEEIVRRLAPTLLATLRDNPDLMNVLLDEED